MTQKINKRGKLFVASLIKYFEWIPLSDVHQQVAFALKINLLTGSHISQAVTKNESLTVCRKRSCINAVRSNIYRIYENREL